jgi:hypothetical protein
LKQKHENRKRKETTADIIIALHFVKLYTSKTNSAAVAAVAAAAATTKT